jgi:hypothetical protein
MSKEAERKTMKISEIIKEEARKQFDPAVFQVGQMYYLLFYDLLSHIQWFGVHFPAATKAGVLRRTAFGLDIDVFTMAEEARWKKRIAKELGIGFRDAGMTPQFKTTYENNLREATKLFLECRNRAALRIVKKIKNLSPDKRQILHDFSRSLIVRFNGLPSAHQRAQFEAGLDDPNAHFPPALADNMPEGNIWASTYDWRSHLEEFDNLIG